MKNKKEIIMRISFWLTLLLVFAHGNAVLGASSFKPNRDSSKTNAEINRENSRRANEMSSWINMSKRWTPKYEKNINDMRLGKGRVELRAPNLRSYYPYTPYYDPFSKKILDTMTAYAYTVDTSDDRKEVNVALNNYRELVFRHTAHLDVVSYALTLSRIDVRFGDEFFFEKVRNSIRNTWEGSANVGLTPENAYNIVTYAEETYILETYGATVEKSEIYEVDGQFYDVRDIVTEGGENVQLFFNVTIPIRTLNIFLALKEKEEKVIIPLQ